MVTVVDKQTGGEAIEPSLLRVCVSCGVARPVGDFRTHRGYNRAVVSATCWLCEVMDKRLLREAEYSAGAAHRPAEYHGDRLDGDWWCDSANPALHWPEGGRHDNIHDEPVRFEDEIDPDGWDGAADPPTKRRKGALRDSDRALYNRRQAVYRGAAGRETIAPWRPDLPLYVDRFGIPRLRGGRERPAYSQPRVRIEATAEFIEKQPGGEGESEGEGEASALDRLPMRPVWLARDDEPLRWRGADGLPSTGDAPSQERIVRMAEAEPDAMRRLRNALREPKARDPHANPDRRRDRHYRKIDKALLYVEEHCSPDATEAALDEVLQHFPDFQRWCQDRREGYAHRGRKPRAA